jgi:hypothetical protein
MRAPRCAAECDTSPPIPQSSTAPKVPYLDFVCHRKRALFSVIVICFRARESYRGSRAIRSRNVQKLSLVLCTIFNSNVTIFLYVICWEAEPPPPNSPFLLPAIRCIPLLIMGSASLIRDFGVQPLDRAIGMEHNISKSHANRQITVRLRYLSCDAPKRTVEGPAQIPRVRLFAGGVPPPPLAFRCGCKFFEPRGLPRWASLAVCK